MKGIDVTDMSTEQFVDRFADIAIAQGEALFNDEFSKFNRLFQQMNAVDNELRDRGTKDRLALLRLFSHPNVQVRLKAAKRTLGVAHREALDLVREIAQSQCFPQAGEAGMTLTNLEDGIFKPD